MLTAISWRFRKLDTLHISRSSIYPAVRILACVKASSARKVYSYSERLSELNWPSLELRIKEIPLFGLTLQDNSWLFY